MKTKHEAAPLFVLLAVASLCAHTLVLMPVTWLLKEQNNAIWFNFVQAVLIFLGTLVICYGLLRKQKWSWYATVLLAPLVFVYEIRIIGMFLLISSLNLFFGGFEPDHQALFLVMSVGTFLLTFGFLLIGCVESRRYFSVIKNESPN